MNPCLPRAHWTNTDGRQKWDCSCIRFAQGDKKPWNYNILCVLSLSTLYIKGKKKFHIKVAIWKYLVNKQNSSQIISKDNFKSISFTSLLTCLQSSASLPLLSHCCMLWCFTASYSRSWPCMCVLVHLLRDILRHFNLTDKNFVKIMETGRLQKVRGAEGGYLIF